MVTMSYKEDVRQQAIDAVLQLRIGNPPKHQMVVDQIVDIIRGAELEEPAGPDTE